MILDTLDRSKIIAKTNANIKTGIKVNIQNQDFDLAEEVNLLEENNEEDGAVVTFSGRVRNNNLGRTVKGLFLEHYPGMTEKSLQQIILKAQEKWNIGRVTVIHRIGQLAVGEQIVFVGVTSKHRKEAFTACEFIMDYLKVDAPFWKKELSDGEEHWLTAKESDQDKASLWVE
jgi:molybdopterin synthase catalytic subunit